jgi:hypothetical protein
MLFQATMAEWTVTSNRTFGLTNSLAVSATPITASMFILPWQLAEKVDGLLLLLLLLLAKKVDGLLLLLLLLLALSVPEIRAEHTL